MFSNSELRFEVPSSWEAISLVIVILYTTIAYILYTDPNITLSDFHSSSLDDVNIAEPY